MLTLPAALTQATASACLLELAAALPAEPAVVVVNAAGLVKFDSAALALLLALRRAALGLGKSLLLQAPPPRMLDLARLYGIADLLVPAASGTPRADAV